MCRFSWFSSLVVAIRIRLVVVAVVLVVLRGQNLPAGPSLGAATTETKAETTNDSKTNDLAPFASFISL